MVKKRSIVIWSEHEDTQLATIIINNLQSGKTQLQAFQTASQQIGRTTSACGFRWNNNLRKKYEDSIEEAKISGKALKGVLSVKESLTNTSDNNKASDVQDPITSIINSVDVVRDKLIGMSKYILELESQLSRKDKEISDLRKEVSEINYYSEDLPLLKLLFKKAHEIGFLDKIS
ncbi:hypothetical protein GC096_04055 [Paenibacillus sp. LMG 31461]|uniref:Transcription factor, RsfA family n=1 Tax=Paenibacillus plantarum TaxID=2654975 RepID=A0ABX1X484_9BACL|nr:hypothetical protein [Paenibacillus plantarum]NOU63220.1 hypothetical protein [Paenibacillus plantarum]